MHPIEHLRYLARAGDADPAWLIPEAAWALGGLATDRNALVMGSRRLLERFPLCAPLWWLCSRALTGTDPRVALRRSVEDFEADTTGLQLSLALTDGGEAEPVVTSAVLATRTEVVVPGTAPHPSGPTRRWVTVGVGVLVSEELCGVATAAATDQAGRLRQQGRLHHRVPLAEFDRVIGPTGAIGPTGFPGTVEVGLLPELTVRGRPG